MSTTIDGQAPTAPPTATTPSPALLGAGHTDAYRDVLFAVQRGLAANWDDDHPRIAVIERNGQATVYVSTARTLRPATRSDIRGAVRAALAPYIALAPYTNVVFLRRQAP